MVNYKTNTPTLSPHFRGGHGLLIGPPLVITSLFCFSLILMHPAPRLTSEATASHQTAHSPVAAQPPLSGRSFAPFASLTPLPEKAVVHSAAHPLQTTTLPPVNPGDATLLAPAPSNSQAPAHLIKPVTASDSRKTNLFSPAKVPAKDKQSNKQKSSR